MPYSTVPELAAYMGLTTFGTREARATVALDMAGDEVKKVAPVPVDTLLLPDYQRRSKNAEKMVAEFLLTTAGFKTSESKGVGGLSKSSGYADMDKVRALIAGPMGPFVVGGGVTSVAALSTWPPRNTLA